MMMNKRRAERTAVDMGVTKYIGGEALMCRACEISATGIRLAQPFDDSPVDQVVEIEVPLVEGKLNTQVSARRVWQDSDFQAYEFIAPTRAQQIMLDRVYRNYSYSSYGPDGVREGVNASPAVQIIRKVEAGMAAS